MSWDKEVFFWWILMSSIGVINIIFWLLILKKQSFNSWLFSGGLYVLGCSTRSFIPRSDIDRVVMFDHFFSSVFVGRTIATIAELGFIAQWAIVLSLIAQEVKDKNILFISRIIFPMIAIAEIFSWYASITTNTLGSVFEESLWGLSFLFIFFALLAVRKYLVPRLRLWALAFSAGILIYVIYMFTIDVPFYYSKWQEGLLNNKSYDFLGTGIFKMMNQWKVSRQYQDWQYEFLWQGLYFSFGVWASLALNLIPPKIKDIVNS
jgi:hypothetical protein